MRGSVKCLAASGSRDRLTRRLPQETQEQTERGGQRRLSQKPRNISCTLGVCAVERSGA
jgi:hypothetical protein